MRDNKFAVIYSILIAITIVLLGVMALQNLKRVPLGAPDNYWDLVDVVDKEDVNIYLYSDDIDFFNDLDYIEVNFMSDFPSETSERFAIFIIDMNKYHKEGYTEDELQDFVDGVIADCQHLILLNNDTAEEDYLKDYNELWSTDSYFITITRNSCHGEIRYRTFSGTVPSNEILTYDLIDQIVRMIDSNIKDE